MRASKIIIILIISIKAGITQDSEFTRSYILSFAKNIESSIENGNPAYLNGAIDYSTVMNGIMDNNTLKLSLDEEFTQHVKFNYGLGDIIAEEIKSSGKFEFINYSTGINNYKLLFRTFTSKGINYYELITELSGKTFRITDAYIYSKSRLYSTLLSKLYYGYCIKNDYWNYELNSNRHLWLMKINIIESLMVQKKFEKAYFFWENLPDNFKFEENILAIAVEASSYINTETTNRLTDCYVSRYGRNNKLYLSVLEGHFYRKEFNSALNSIDSLSLVTYNDPFLNLYRGLIYTEMNNISQAEWYYKEFINAMPFESTGYFSLLELYLTNRKYNSATDLLDNLSLRFGYFKQDFSGILKGYPGFLNSEAYYNWINN